MENDLEVRRANHEMTRTDLPGAVGVTRREVTTRSSGTQVDCIVRSRLLQRRADEATALYAVYRTYPAESLYRQLG